MTNFNVLLRQEVSRVARKETRAQIKQLKSASASYRRGIAALKRQLAQQARELAQLKRSSARALPAPLETAEGSVRFRADGVAAHRKRLGLSAENFGRLVGVTGQTIYNWESGKRPRPAQLKALSAVRAIGRREATARLEKLGKPASRTPSAKKRAARRPARKRNR